MYIILKGTVGVKKTDSAFGHESVLVATLREGDHFGELALITSGNDSPESQLVRRRASCVCFEDCDLIGFDGQIVNRIVNELLNT